MVHDLQELADDAVVEAVIAVLCEKAPKRLRAAEPIGFCPQHLDASPNDHPMVEGPPAERAQRFSAGLDNLVLVGGQDVLLRVPSL